MCSLLDVSDVLKPDSFSPINLKIKLLFRFTHSRSNSLLPAVSISVKPLIAPEDGFTAVCLVFDRSNIIKNVVSTEETKI